MSERCKKYVMVHYRCSDLRLFSVIFSVSPRFMTAVTAISATLGVTFSDGVSLLSC